MGRKKSLAWDSWNKNHIKKHKVTTKEVEEVYQSKTLKKQSYQNRWLVLGKTKKSRLLTIVISKEKQSSPYVVSARDMSAKERRFYYEKTKTH